MTAITEPDPWQEAYLRFETPAQERRKFIKRLERLGARRWPLDATIVELCCGRGNGLVALEHFGFRRVVGIDLSPLLAAKYDGGAAIHVADCRALPFNDRSVDVVLVNGGLHHLLELPRDLQLALGEAHRILRTDGRFGFVEPWSTPFLRLAHLACESTILRRTWNKLDALAVMTEHERDTYENWLDQPQTIRAAVTEQFATEWESVRLGKWSFVGHKR